MRKLRFKLKPRPRRIRGLAAHIRAFTFGKGNRSRHVTKTIPEGFTGVRRPEFYVIKL